MHTDSNHTSMATKGVLVSPAIIAGAVIVLLGMGVWLLLAMMNDDAVSVADTTASPTPTVSASATATATPTPLTSATPKPSPAAGWLRYTVASTGISFDYPGVIEEVSTVTVAGEKGTNVTTTLKKSAAGSNAIVTLVSRTTDYRSFGRGLMFTDFEGYEKSGDTYKLYFYEVESGDKSSLRDLPSSYTYEEVTARGELKVLITKGSITQEDGPTAAPNGFGAVVMLPKSSPYRSVTVEAASESMTYADFTALVKSFDLTN